jgi:hypothetical protein
MSEYKTVKGLSLQLDLILMAKYHQLHNKYIYLKKLFKINFAVRERFFDTSF